MIQPYYYLKSLTFMFISRSLFKVGSNLRNPHLSQNLSFLKNSESWSLERLQRYQFDRCRQLFQFCERHSPFYLHHFKKFDFSVDQFQSLDQLRRLPAITKQQLISQNSEIHTTESFRFKKLFVSETSGSTGEPLLFMKDEEWDSWNRAAIFRGYSWYGVQPWERNGYFWGYNVDPGKAWKIKFLDMLQNRFRVFSYNKQELVAFIHRLETASYLHGYSSMIYEVARIINAAGIDTSKLNLKLVKGTSEKIYAHYQDEVRKAFGQKIVSEYGAAEAGIIAFECPQGSMHLNMEGCIVEEEDGEIVVTNLNSYSFPVIRYRLGDSIVLEDEDFFCPCGMQHRVLREVTGRIGVRIYGYRSIYPSLTIYYVFKNIYLGSGMGINGQFVQTNKGHLTVKIEGPLTKRGRQLLDQELSFYFGDDMEWEFEEDAMIHTMDGKRKDFISLIDVI